MADFKTPNLCGANESLNTALSKIDDIKAEIESKLDSAASEAAAAFETAQADIKAGLDALAVDLPEAKPVNLQSEITSLINDVDRTTAGGIASFNAKVAALKKDFGGALEKKGLDFDKLIDDSSAKLGKDVQAASDFLTGTGEGSLTGELTSAFGLSGETVNLSSGGGIAGVSGNISEYVAPTTTVTGGNLCDLVPNLELPADLAGTGVTTEEVEERASNATTLTLTQTPEEILEVTGKKTNQSFFGNIQYTLNGKVIVPKATGTYSEIKVKYTISKIAEKPIAAKQADVPAETEEVSIVTNNTGALSTKTTLADITTSYETPPGEEGSVYEKTEKSSPVVVPTGKTVKATTPADSVQPTKKSAKKQESVLKSNAVRRETKEGGIITGSVITETTGTDEEGFKYTKVERTKPTYSLNGFTYRVKVKTARYLVSEWYNEETPNRKKKFIEWDGSNTLPLPEKYPEPIQVLSIGAEVLEADEDGIPETPRGGYWSSYNPEMRRIRIEYGSFDGLDIGRAFGMTEPDSLNGEVRIQYRYYDKLNPLNKPK
jgi:hypothetical protein